MALVDEVDETARAIGAANTVTRRGDRLVATNTDWIGLTRALERETPLAGRHAVVLGAGGTARAALFALGRAGATCTVLNRTPERGAELARELGAAGSGGLGRPLGPGARHRDQHHERRAPSGVSPVEAAALRADTVVFDAVYDPPQTRLLADALAAGARTVGGKWMLVYQAIEQIFAWTAKRPDPEILANAFDAFAAEG